MKHIYTSVDIGSDSIKVVTCELFKNKINLLAASSFKSEGVKKGLITDPELASEALKQAFEEVEGMLGVKIKKVLASIPSYFAEFEVVSGKTKIEGLDKVVKKEDIINVLQNAVTSKISSGKEMVTILPIDFTLDNDKNLRDPKGLEGNELEARGILVTTPKRNIYSVISLINSIGVEVIDISINSIGDIHAFKTKELDNKIGAIINIGSELTTVSLYNKGILVRNSILQLGGKNIDNDISYIYKIDRLEAKKLKEKFAFAHKMYAQVNDTIDIMNNLGEKIKINQYELSAIAMTRIEELLMLAKKEMNVLTNRQIDYIIITGGTSNMIHFDYIAEQVFGKGVTIGNIKLVGIRNNKYASALGNIVYFISKLKLKGQDYSMFSKTDVEDLSSSRRNLINVSNESMFGKVLGFFFNE
jgi:cell division protein FtsA